MNLFKFIVNIIVVGGMAFYMGNIEKSTKNSLKTVWGTVSKESRQITGVCWMRKEN